MSCRASRSRITPLGCGGGADHLAAHVIRASRSTWRRRSVVGDACASSPADGPRAPAASPCSTRAPCVVGRNLARDPGDPGPRARGRRRRRPAPRRPVRIQDVKDLDPGHPAPDAPRTDHLAGGSRRMRRVRPARSLGGYRSTISQPGRSSPGGSGHGRRLPALHRRRVPRRRSPARRSPPTNPATGEKIADVAKARQGGRGRAPSRPPARRSTRARGAA